MLRSDLCEFTDAYIVVKGDITLTKAANRNFIDVTNRFLAFLKNAPFTNCISKINNVLIANAEDLDVVMPMYNLFEYSKNYRKTTESLWNYYRDEPNNPPVANYNADPITDSTSFKYKISITEKTSNSWKTSKPANRNFIDVRKRFFAFKNNAPFTNCIVYNVLLDNAQDLDVVMAIYNFLEYRKNYRKTTGS